MRTAAVGLCTFVLGVLLALMLRPPPPEPPPPPACPPPPPCPTCGPTVAAAAPRRSPSPPAQPKRAPEATRALPETRLDPDTYRDRLRSWFEASADGLADCLGKNEPLRRALIEIKIEPDGRITDADLLGATDLSARATACVRDRVKALHAPREMLRGRETLVVHVNL